MMPWALYCCWPSRRGYWILEWGWKAQGILETSVWWTDSTATTHKHHMSLSPQATEGTECEITIWSIRAHLLLLGHLTFCWVLFMIERGAQHTAHVVFRYRLNKAWGFRVLIICMSTMNPRLTYPVLFFLGKNLLELLLIRVTIGRIVLCSSQASAMVTIYTLGYHIGRDHSILKF